MFLNFINPLMAAPAEGGGSGLSSIFMMVAVIAVMYFFMIRPQQKRQKELLKFRESLQKGDKVITAGGIYGTVKEVFDTYILLAVDGAVSIKVDKTMIMKESADIAKQ